MDWYYAEEGEQRGPVDELAFDDLVQSGTITRETLVWRDGMSDWLPYGDLGTVASGGQSGAGTSAAGQTRECHECGRLFPVEDMIRFGNTWICGTCKPMFVQKMREGASMPLDVVYGGFWIRFAAKFIDSILLFIANMAISFIFGLLTQPIGNINDSEVNMPLFLGMQLILFIFQVSVGIGYSTWFLGKYGATPGKMVCHLKVVTPEGDPVTYRRAFGRYFAEILSGMILGIGYIMAGFDEEKRTLHDRIVHTRVIRA